ncbi:MAG: DUF3237 domain-containing protein [Nevskiales bacterium]|nr:DUF3237 domain-containing protein [Nevskiales bacterium]
MFDYTLEHLCSYSARLEAPPEMIGAVPGGVRVNFYVTGGEVEGPKLRGRLRPVGGDWMTVREDGVGILDVRATIETDDGALIEITYQGVGDLGPDGHAALLAGTLPPRLTLRTAPRVRTAHPDYLWMNRLQLIGVGEANLETFEVRYDVYAVR